MQNTFCNRYWSLARSHCGRHYDSASHTLQTRYNADVGIHNTRPRYKWVALYRGSLLRNKWFTVMTKNVYFHDNVMFIPKTSPGLTASVLVYSFSLRSLVFLSSVGRESCTRSDTLAQCFPNCVPLKRLKWAAIVLCFDKTFCMLHHFRYKVCEE